jgi:hypothetical protein
LIVTHQALLESIKHPGIPLVMCPGELAHHGDYEDTVVVAGLMVVRTVTLRICKGCGHCISVADGVLLNDYPPPAPFKRPKLLIDPRD